MERRRLGRTGHLSSVAKFDAAAPSPRLPSAWTGRSSVTPAEWCLAQTVGRLRADRHAPAGRISQTLVAL